MNIKKYTELTGRVISPSEEALYKASIGRTRAMLETLLGYSLAPSNFYNEKGKARTECACSNIDILNLLPADDEEGSYRLFRYNKNDKFLHVDPYTNVHKVKLVHVHKDGEFITVKDIKNFKPQMGRDGIGSYIERCESCFCDCDCDDCVQLAIDADWITCYPDDLLYLWVDMIDYQNDCKRGLKSESVEGHSWSKTDAATTSPELLPHNKLLLKRYAGPYGSVAVMPT